MSDLIDRQAAIDALANVARDNFNLSDEFEFYLKGLTDAEDAIYGLPSAEPERKKGKWIRHITHSQRSLNGHRECSVCHVWLDWDMPRNSFCPNCGADTRGEKDE